MTMGMMKHVLTQTSLIRFILVAWIWFATCVDIYCCKWLVHELNPLANLLFSYDPWLLVSCKVFGTFLATELLRRLPLWYTIVIAVGFVFLLIKLGT